MQQELLQRICENRVSSWTNEMLSLTSKGESVLEIGSGSGETSLVLSLNGRVATALDFSKSCLELTDRVSKELNIDVKTVFADAMKDLPFNDNEFDVIFQAGLLEHFERDERINLLKNWGRCCKRMVSMIPNAASLAYRTGKAISEKNGTWIWGKELPQYSLACEFHLAGFHVTEEYTIDVKAALGFLPRFHYLRILLHKWQKENVCQDNCGQGYLLVTVGEKNKL
jgi:ubiquinone/menaquinone biosynthesis C-methylase UbiE